MLNIRQIALLKSLFWSLQQKDKCKNMHDFINLLINGKKLYFNMHLQMIGEPSF